MFREIRVSEKITEEDLKEMEKENAYKRIKPKTNMSDKEVNDFWSQIFLETSLNG